MADPKDMIPPMVREMRAEDAVMQIAALDKRLDQLERTMRAMEARAS